jgi:AraC family transcriptional regulator
MTVRRLYSSPLLSVNEFRCPLGDEAWTEPNEITAPSPLVVFPRLPVLISHADADPVLATPNIAMLYRPGQVYERAARDPRGDDCLYIELRDAAFPAATHAPTAPWTFLRQHLLARYLHGGEVDPLLVEETALVLVEHVLGNVVSKHRTPRHTRLAEDAKELLAQTLAGSVPLHELAAQLNVSPFHLARVFRRETGYGLHEYRLQLRLRLALARLPARGRLTQLALELGFASHSHFTAAFRREFGVTPSALAHDFDSGDEHALRTVAAWTSGSARGTARGRAAQARTA